MLLLFPQWISQESNRNTHESLASLAPFLRCVRIVSFSCLDLTVGLLFAVPRVCFHRRLRVCWRHRRYPLRGPVCQLHGPSLPASIAMTLV